ncbi:MAG: hypothetical protein A2Y28_04420 [Chlamydiae bacterium GWC2_50_10]|nr:MAG: hypothetical protein A2Y28_04420 [Chlamydiae bacterium GWC2_50_10]HAZ15201.1 hypothetical protein [Parachlamydiales bacterium]HCJ82761.1 hypothetical protein [Parachlamydiales bacterium]
MSCWIGDFPKKALDVLPWIFKMFRVWEATESFRAECKKDKPNYVNMAAQATFAAMQLAEGAVAYKQDSFSSNTRMIVTTATGMADLSSQIASGSSLSSVVSTGLCRSMEGFSLAEHLKFIGTDKRRDEILKLVYTAIQLRAPLYNIYVAFKGFDSCGTFEKQTQRVQAATISVLQPAVASPQRDRVTLLAVDEQFKQWLRERAGSLQFFCPATGALMIHPVRCRVRRELFVDLSALQGAGLSIHDVDYSRNDFERGVDAEKQEEFHCAFVELSDQFAREWLEEYEALVRRQFYERMVNWQQLEELPEDFSLIVNVENWLRCASTGRLIRFVVVPDLGALDVQAPPLCYERSEIENRLHQNPTAAPPRWPASLPFIRENVKVSPVLQQVISNYLSIAAARCQEALAHIHSG